MYCTTCAATIPRYSLAESNLDVELQDDIFAGWVNSVQALHSRLFRSRVSFCAALLLLFFYRNRIAARVDDDESQVDEEVCDIIRLKYSC